jgi:ATP-dependent DNA helicase RecG
VIPLKLETLLEGRVVEQDRVEYKRGKFNAVPFDDRVNREAKISDIRRGFVEDFLVESNSSLAGEINDKPLEDLLYAMEVANATDVGIDIRNIGILMFSEHPEKFMPGAQIELIRFNSPEAEGSDDFTEKVFTGPLQKQIRDALSYIQATLIEEKVVKRPDKAEAERFFNYPYAAVEEALVNAVFHRSYRIQEPVEIRIYLDCIKIINYPGPEKWIDMNQFKTGKVIARRYRNRRIGEFLKEIDLSEKKSTGITKILRALEKNNSPLPEFETDEDRNYLITTIKKNPAFELNNIMDETAWTKKRKMAAHGEDIALHTDGALRCNYCELLLHRWKPRYGLEDMYRRMMGDWREDRDLL